MCSNNTGRSPYGLKSSNREQALGKIYFIDRCCVSGDCGALCVQSEIRVHVPALYGFDCHVICNNMASPPPLSFLSQAHMHTKFAPWLWVRILIMNIPENVWKPSARQALSALGSLRQCDIHDKPIWGKCFEEIAHNLLLSGNRPFNNLFDYLCWVLYLMKETVSISKDSIYCSQLFNDAILVKVLHVSLSITFGRRSSSWQP